MKNRRSTFKGFRAKQPSYGPPIEGHGICRRTMNEAVRVGDYSKADRIAATKRRKVYASLSKPELIRYLREV